MLKSFLASLKILGPILGLTKSGLLARDPSRKAVEEASGLKDHCSSWLVLLRFLKEVKNNHEEHKASGM